VLVVWQVFLPFQQVLHPLGIVCTNKEKQLYIGVNMPKELFADQRS